MMRKKKKQQLLDLLKYTKDKWGEIVIEIKNKRNIELKASKKRKKVW